MQGGAGRLTASSNAPSNFGLDHSQPEEAFGRHANPQATPFGRPGQRDGCARQQVLAEFCGVSRGAGRRRFSRVQPSIGPKPRALRMARGSPREPQRAFHRNSCPRAFFGVEPFQHVKLRPRGATRRRGAGSGGTAFPSGCTQSGWVIGHGNPAAARPTPLNARVRSTACSSAATHAPNMSDVLTPRRASPHRSTPFVSRETATGLQPGTQEAPARFT